MYPVNKKDNSSQIVQRIDNLVMAESEKLLTALNDKSEDLAGIIDILKDRTLQSQEPGFPIALAKVAELQLQALKQKNDVLKNLTAYKTTELSGMRRGPGELSISDLLNSAALGAGIGSKLNMSGAIQPKLVDSSGNTTDSIEIEITPVEQQSPEQIADTLMKDFK